MSSQEKPKDLIYLEKLVSYLIEQYQPNIVLDVGCGKGEMVALFRQRGISAFGFDASLTALRSCPREIQDFVWQGFADKGTLPCRDSSVDIMVVHHVMEHLDNPDSFLKEAIRVLKPNGVLVAVIPTLPFGTLNLWKSLHVQRCPDHINMHTRGWWKKRFIYHGFYVEMQRGFRDIVKQDPPAFFIAEVLNRFGILGRYLSIKMIEIIRSAFIARKVL